MNHGRHDSRQRVIRLTLDKPIRRTSMQQETNAELNLSGRSWG